MGSKKRTDHGIARCPDDGASAPVPARTVSLPFTTTGSGLQWVVAEGAGLGVCAGAGELLAVADGLDVALLDGVGVAWLAPGEGVAVAEGVGVAPPFAGPAEEVVVAIRIPATIATMPVLTPTASSTRVQVEAGAVPGVGPSPVNGMPL